MTSHSRPLFFQIPRVRSQSRAGLSRKCDFAYFHDRRKVSVHQLSISSTFASNEVTDPSRLSREFFSHIVGSQDTVIHRVAIDGQWIAISTNQDLVIINMRDRSMTPRRAHGDWEPIGLAMHESDGQLSVVLGQRKRGNIAYQGRVLLFTIRLSASLGSFDSEPYLYALPQNDIPMDVDINADGTLLLCRTRLRNSVIVWELFASPAPVRAPFIIPRSCHTPVSILVARTLKNSVTEARANQETGIYGVTSASTYTSTSNRRYLFCATFASSERWRNGGEWPFCSPIIFPPEQSSEGSTHNLESLRHKSRLVAAAVSSKVHVWAVLEMSGKISILGLKAHDREGICVSDEEPITIQASLSAQTTQSQICPSALRFDPEGTKLFALGVDGKLVVVDFAESQHLPDPSSPSSSKSSKSRLPFFHRSRS